MRIAIDWKSRGRELAILTAIGTFMAFVSPFGSTDDIPFWKGWLFWTGLIVGGSVIGTTITNITLDRLFGRLPDLIILVIISVVIAVIMTPIVILAAIAIRGAWDFPLTPSYIGFMLFVVWLISAFMTGIGYLMSRAFGLEGVDFDHVTDEIDPTKAFLERLPIKYRAATLYAVSSEDHYLRVHTSAGEELILMRLADAVRELSNAKGYQTHRSWWVSEVGLEDTERENGRTVLVLKSGVKAPVSRTYQPALREAGWLN